MKNLLVRQGRVLCLETGAVPDLAWQSREVRAKVGEQNLRMYFFLWISIEEGGARHPWFSEPYPEQTNQSHFF